MRGSFRIAYTAGPNEPLSLAILTLESGHGVTQRDRRINPFPPTGYTYQDRSGRHPYMIGYLLNSMHDAVGPDNWPRLDRHPIVRRLSRRPSGMRRHCAERRRTRRPAPRRRAYAASLSLPSPTRAASDAAMNSSRSPSSTFCGSERSTPVRRSFTI